MCFPCAGGGPSEFRGWSQWLPTSVEVVGIRLPGRESRLHEPPATRVAPLALALADSLDCVSTPLVFFGHSFGALLAFETARELRRRGTEPSALLVAACRAPHLKARRAPLSEAPDTELIAFIGMLQDPQLLLSEPELAEIVLPVLRADFQAYDTYVYEEEAPLMCRIVAFGGTHDPEVDAEELDAWRRHTTSSFRGHMLSGGHFFQRDRPAELLGRVAPLVEDLLD